MSRVFSLPQAPLQYDAKVFQQLLDYIRELDALAYKRQQDVEIYTPPVNNRQQELILVSPGGIKYGLRVNDAGTLSTVAV